MLKSESCRSMFRRNSLEAEAVKKKQGELFTLVQAHHFSYGETLVFNCPHCDEEVMVELKALDGDPDTIEVFWGKNSEEIEKKREKVSRQLADSGVV